MKKISIQAEHLKNEKTQSFLRVFLIFIIVVTLLLFNKDAFYYRAFASTTVKDIMVVVLIVNLLYYLFIVRFPELFVQLRIVLISMMDVFTSLYVMHLVGDYALYYPFLMLWYSIGYSMRYGNAIGFFVYASVLMGWLVLIYTTDVWRDNLPMSFGWFIAFAIIPLYAFKLVNELHKSINILHKNLDNSIFQAEHDQLTELPNRQFFEKELHHALKSYKKFALLFIDLDGFKEINDTYGHHTGDKVLREVAKRMREHKYFSARLGGDEFVFIIPYKNRDEVATFADSLVKSIAKKCPLLDIEFSASVGIALYPEDANTPYELKKKSDSAMYHAKERGKNQFSFYSSSSNEVCLVTTR